MPNVDNRIVRVSIEIDGKLNIYEDLDITASGQKAGSALENTCDVKISNLSRDTRNYLLTETSPFNKNRTRKRLIVEAGRVSTGTTRVFVGDIISASPTQPPDIGLKLKAQTGAFMKGKIIARNGRDQQSLKSIAELAAKDAGVTLDFRAKDKQIANYMYSGGALGQVDKVAEAGDVNVFVDDEILVVKDKGQPLPNRTKILRLDTGLIGVPEVTERGVKCKFLFDGETVLGGAIDLKSELNPSLDGQYTIYKLAFELASRNTAFYYTCEATRND